MTTRIENKLDQRPCGRGSWAFEFWTMGGERSEMWWTPKVTLTEARRMAVAEAQRRGAMVMWVVP